MRTHTVHVTSDFAKPVEAVFAYLSEHENLGDLLGAKIERLHDGDSDRNGVGSVRQLRVGPLPPFEETITAFDPPRRIEYRITKGSPIRDHLGVMEFSPLPGGGSHLDYRIRLGSPIPGVALAVKTSLTRSISKSLGQLDSRA